MWDVAGLKIDLDASAFEKGRRQAEDFQEAVDDAEQSLSRLARVAGTALGTLVGTMAAAFSVRALMQYADAWSDMQSRVGAAVKNMEVAPELMQRVVQIANASYSPLNQTVETYARNVMILQELGYSAEQAADYTESLNHMLVITATKGERAASVQGALSKAMAVGKLRADDLESVLNSGGRVAQALAKQLGTTVNGLREMSSEGKITSQVISEALIGSLQEVREEAGQMPATIADGFTRIQTGIQAFIGQLDQAMQVSGSFANLLVSIGDGIAAIAMVDFGTVLNSITDGVVLLGQALLILAATRIPALLTGLAATNFSLGLMTLQFTAGAAASRLMTVALAAQATAARGLGAAMSFVGGPIGLAIAAMAAVGVAVWNTRRSYQEWEEASKATADAQIKLNEAMQAFSEIKSMDTVGAAMQAARDQVATIEAEIALLEESLAKTLNWEMFLTLGLDTSKSDALRAQLEGLKGELVGSMAILDMLEMEWDNIQSKTAQEKAGVVALNAEQQKALETANGMVRSYQERARLAQLQRDFGKDSIAYGAELYRQERAALEAKLATLDVANDVKDAIRRAWQEEQVATGKSREWEAQMDILRRTGQQALEVIQSISNTEPGATWLDTAISKATSLWNVLKQSAAEYANLTPLMLDDAGNPTNLPGRPRPPPPRPMDLGVPDPVIGSGRVGGGGGGGSLREELSDSERVLKALREEAELLRIAMSSTELQTEIWQKLREAGVEASSETGKVIADTIAQIDGMKKLQEATDAWRESISAAFSEFVLRGGSFRDMLSQIIAKLAEMVFSRGFEALWSNIGGDNILGGVFKTLGIGANANGTDNWRGGLTRVNERGGEIMNLPRGTQIIPHDISKRMADGGGRAGPVQINVNVSGARGNSEIESMVAEGVRSGIAQYDRQALPMRIKQISADGRRIG